MRIWVAFAATTVIGLAMWAGEQPPARPPVQQPKPTPVEQADEPTRITVDVTNVDMLFTVTDKKGRFVTDLAKTDFEVFEGKKPQTIHEFSAESDLPLRQIALRAELLDGLRLLAFEH